jgi:tetratricopeptide (TPR) repeat protein
MMRRARVAVRPGVAAILALGTVSAVTLGPALPVVRPALQQAASGPVPPMRLDSARVVTAETLARLSERSRDPGRPQDWFNLGAALLRSGDWEGAIEPLQRALGTEDEKLERAATYDLALARALAARPRELGGEMVFAERRPLLEQAWDGFRWVLLEEPGAEDARWNLELVGRWLAQEEEPQDQGGGAGAGGGADEMDQRETPSTPELSAAQALDLLEQAARAEQDVQGRRLERNRSRDPVVRKNW